VSRVHVTRTGFTPLKGTRHSERSSVELTWDGPDGDRAFCLVDPVRGRVLRTVENPSLMRTVASWDGSVLAATLPDEVVEGTPEPTGESVKVDYWGRVAALDLLDGPWAAAYSRHLGLDVVLARAGAPGEVVYGAPVSLVTTGSVDEVSHHVGVEVAAAQFRATFAVHTDTPHVEDDWLGLRLDIGAAQVEVRSAIPRCAVVDLDPETGTRRARVLQALAGYRRVGTDIFFGVDAVVTRAGPVHHGDAVTVAPSLVAPGREG
jgi:uncharacterized protein YcbX